MKTVDITDFQNLYASFMRLKENPKEVDVQIVESTKDSKDDRED